MNTKEIRYALIKLNNALLEKGYSHPDCDLTVTGSDPVTVWVKTSRLAEIAGIFASVEGDTVREALDNALSDIEARESVDDYKKKEAVKSFGRSIDALRTAGFDADFIDPLAANLKAMSENLLTHQSSVETVQ